MAHGCIVARVARGDIIRILRVYECLVPTVIIMIQIAGNIVELAPRNFDVLCVLEKWHIGAEEMVIVRGEGRALFYGPTDWGWRCKLQGLKGQRLWQAIL